MYAKSRVSEPPTGFRWLIFRSCKMISCFSGGDKIYDVRNTNDHLYSSHENVNVNVNDRDEDINRFITKSINGYKQYASEYNAEFKPSITEATITRRLLKQYSAKTYETITTNNIVTKSEEDAFYKAKKHPFLLMTYPENIKNDIEKHKYEARKALETLEDGENQDCIKEVCMKLIERIEKIERAAQEKVVYHCIGNEISCNICNKIYPVHRSIRDIKTKKDFILELLFAITNTKKDSSIHAMSLLWIAVRKINSIYNNDVELKIFNVYKLYGEKSRSHYKIKSDETLKINTFGEAEINSSLLNQLHPIYKVSACYVKTNDNNKDFIDQNSLYLSGTSGMCSSFYNIYSLLGISFTSNFGIKLAEIMSSFVVGLGFHTFQEAYDSFNITHYSLYPTEQAVILPELNGMKEIGC